MFSISHAVAAEDAVLREAVVRVRAFWEKAEKDPTFDPIYGALEETHASLDRTIEELRASALEQTDSDLQIQAWERLIPYLSVRDDARGDRQVTSTLKRLSRIYDEAGDKAGYWIAQGRLAENAGQIYRAVQAYRRAASVPAEVERRAPFWEFLTQKFKYFKRTRAFRLAVFLEGSATYRCEIDSQLVKRVSFIRYGARVRQCEAERLAGQAVQSILETQPIESFRQALTEALRSEKWRDLRQHEELLTEKASPTIAILFSMDRKSIDAPLDREWLRFADLSFRQNHPRLAEFILDSSEASEALIDPDRDPETYRAARRLYERRILGKGPFVFAYETWRIGRDVAIHIGVSLVFTAVCWYALPAMLRAVGVASLARGSMQSLVVMKRNYWIKLALAPPLAVAGPMLGQLMRKPDPDHPRRTFQEMFFTGRGLVDLTYNILIISTVTILARKAWPLPMQATAAAAAASAFTIGTRLYYDQPLSTNEISFNASYGAGGAVFYGAIIHHLTDMIAMRKAGYLASAGIVSANSLAASLLFHKFLDGIQERRERRPEWDYDALPPILNPNMPLPDDPDVLMASVRDLLSESRY